MRKRRAFADRELEAVMFQREQQQQVAASIAAAEMQRITAAAAAATAANNNIAPSVSSIYSSVASALPAHPLHPFLFRLFPFGHPSAQVHLLMEKDRMHPTDPAAGLDLQISKSQPEDDPSDPSDNLTDTSNDSDDDDDVEVDVTSNVEMMTDAGKQTMVSTTIPPSAASVRAKISFSVESIMSRR